MADLCHQFGSDMIASATGDVLTVSGQNETTQRLLRRYFTNRGDYIWQLNYGAGLLAQIGRPTSAGELQAVIQQQTLLEPGIATTPAPVVTVTEAVGNTGLFNILVVYTSALTGVPVPLSFTVGQ